MTRSILATVAVFLAVAAPSSAGRIEAVQDPIADSYIVVLKADAARVQREAHSQRPLVAVLPASSRAPTAARRRLPARAQGLRRPADRREAAAALANDPRVAYVEPDQVVEAVATQTPGDVGARPDRPARPAARQHLHLQPDRRRASTPTSSTPASAPPTSSSPAASATASTPSTTGRARTTATATAPTSPAPIGGTTYGVAKQVHAPRRPRPRLQRLAARLRRHRRRSTGSPPNHARAGRGEHEPRRRRLDRARPGGRQLDRSRASATRSPPATRNADACNSSPARVAVGEHRRRHDEHRRSGLVLELRHLRRHLRAGLEHHLVLEHAATPRPTRSAARRWRRRTWPARSPSTCRRTRPRRRRRRRRRCSRNSTPNKVTSPGTGSPNRLLYSLFGGTAAG